MADNQPPPSQTMSHTTITGSENIEAFRLLALKGALKMETIGLKRRGRSAFAIVKTETGLKANSAKALLPLYINYLQERGILPLS